MPINTATKNRLRRVSQVDKKMKKVMVKTHKRKSKSGKITLIRKYDRKSNKEKKRFIITLNIEKNKSFIHAIVYEYYGNYLPNRKFTVYDLHDPKVTVNDYHFDTLDAMIKKIVRFENGHKQLMDTVNSKLKNYGFTKKELGYIKSKIGQ